MIYAIKATGELLWYRDLASNGTWNWAPHSGNQIGTGWSQFAHVFSGSDGVIYGIKPTGELLWCKDIKRDGTNGAQGETGWAVNSGRQVGTGWDTVRPTNSSMVVGQSEAGVGVWGESTNWHGVYGHSKTEHGVWGASDAGSGIVGIAQRWHGVFGQTQAAGAAGVWGENQTQGTGVVGLSTNGIGVFGKGGRLAGYFEGDVEVTGDIRLTNADCAEDFTIGVESAVDPGTVMVVGADGALFPSQHAYDKCVAGVISGAGEYKPGIVLDKQQSDLTRQPIALVGKVFCKVDAQYGAITVGDLLTTSPTPGYAMKVSDPLKAIGAMLGKALRPLEEGQGMIPVLIALQ